MADAVFLEHQSKRVLGTSKVDLDQGNFIRCNLYYAAAISSRPKIHNVDFNDNTHYRA
jgi:hypothetical protein